MRGCVTYTAIQVLDGSIYHGQDAEFIKFTKEGYALVKLRDPDNSNKDQLYLLLENEHTKHCYEISYW